MLQTLVADRIAWVLVGAVILVWLATTLVLPFVIKDYTPPPSAGTVMGSLAGGAAAYLFAKRGVNGKSESEKKKPETRRKKVQ